MIVARIAALEKFLGAEDAASLLAGLLKRAVNILKAEEKKDGTGASRSTRKPICASSRRNTRWRRR